MTSAQVSLLGRYTREAVLIFDADEGGQKATQRSLELFLQEGISARVVSLPGGFDPDSFIRQEKMDGFERLLAEALPVMDYMLEQALRRHATGNGRGEGPGGPGTDAGSESPAGPSGAELVRRTGGQPPGTERIPNPRPIKGNPGPSDPGRGKQPGGYPAARLMKGSFCSSCSCSLKSSRTSRKSWVRTGFPTPVIRNWPGRFMLSGKSRRRWNVQELLSRVGDEDIKDLTSELLLTEESVIDADRMLRDCLRQSKALPGPPGDPACG